MQKFMILLLVVGLLPWSCATQKESTGENPLLSDFDTPFGVPPFDKIEVEHYMPAYLEGMDQEQKEIEAIVNNTEAPTFANTIEAMDRTGLLLSRVGNVFNNLNSSDTNEEMQKIAKEVAPLLSKHNDDIFLNEKLFARVKEVYEQKDNLELTGEQAKLLDEYYKDFVRGGANLSAADKQQFRKINEELAVLTVQFGENVLKEIKKYKLVVDNKEDLAGLPESLVNSSAEAAKQAGLEGKWLFTIDKSVLIPFLQYSEKRDLREKMFKAYINQGNHNDELDNKKILSRIAALRVKRANLLGYKTHADYILDENMAKTPERVYDFLDGLWKPALKVAKKEAKELQALINKEGHDFKLKPWDWWYYAEKLRKQKYDLDDEALRPYFKLDNVIDGVFAVASKLYGIQFVELKDVPKYHEDVRAYQVKEADGTHIGVLYADYYTRSGTKRGGAWMSAFRRQWGKGKQKVAPIITNNGNFPRPGSDKPSLLSLDEALTLFHEFGHGLHGLLSNCTYRKLSGTAVTRDFVELPSQIMENWALEPEVLRMYARHYQTNEAIPEQLIEKIRKSSLFNQGFVTVEYLAASYLDMDWHTLTEPKELDCEQFENQSMAKIGLIPEIVVRYRSPYFRHVFSGGYSSGYYSYIWAEQLDADAFEAFKETSLFDQEKAKSFRENILAAGGTDDPMNLYIKFRGREPRIEPLLKKRGLLN